MSDLSVLFSAQDKVARWRAERESASTNLELAMMRENMAFLISQHEPVASLGLDRERLRLVLGYVVHGDLRRLDRDFVALRVSEIKPIAASTEETKP